jgi:hypothetical protein
MEDFAPLSTASGACAGGFESIWLALAHSERVEQVEAADASSHDYHPELATPELIVQIRRLLAAERRVGRLVCRYLADLADRIHGQRDRELLAYVDEFQAAACFFELGAREVRERVRIGRALRQLPQIEAAFIAGELSYSRVREVTRVAQPDTESAWLACARDLDMRTLERRVAGTEEELARRRHLDEAAEYRGAADALETFDGGSAHDNETTAKSRAATDGATDAVHAAGAYALSSTRGSDAADGAIDAVDAAGAYALSSTRGSDAAERASRALPREQARMHTRWLDHDSLRVTFELPAEVWALLERALEGARQRAATPLGDAEALAAVVRDALASQNQAADASDPRCSVVVYECARCGKSDLDTGVGGFELEPAAAATLGCGAREIELAREGRGVQRGGPLPTAIRRAVLLRDRCRCRVPSCSRRRYVDVHHLIARFDDGDHSRSNCITLCSTHHRRLHEGKLLITGDADAEPVFQDAAKRTVARFDAQSDARASQGAGHARGGECAARRQAEEHAADSEHAAPTGPLERHSLDSERATALRRAEGHAGDSESPTTPAPQGRHSSNDGSPSAQQRGKNAWHGECAMSVARRERQGNESDNIDDGTTHLGTSNDTAPARRDRQRNEPNDDVDDGATHLGTWNDSTPARRERQRNEPDDDIDGGAAHLGKLNDNALRLLQIMGRRGSWTSDLLFERSALPFPELQHAILLLELEGRARRRGCEIDAV